MVKGADQLVAASRLCSNEADLTQNTMICTLLLGMACRYTEQQTRGWILINESIQCACFLGLAQEKDLMHKNYYEHSIVDEQLCKRAFWMLIMI
jgi:hypothetical protein